MLNVFLEHKENTHEQGSTKKFRKSKKKTLNRENSTPRKKIRIVYCIKWKGIRENKTPQIEKKSPDRVNFTPRKTIFIIVTK